MTFDVKVRERILKPISEVFDAFVDPVKMANYFISGASGPLEEGAHVTWEFADVGAKVGIDVLEVNKDSKIVYESSALGRLLRTTISFDADGPDATVVTVIDASFELDEDGVNLALGQNAGWTYTLCALKAYLQFGVNLRTGLNRRLADVS
ncbi:SRPBCC domain-containing protein [Mesorhizobium sp. B2-4-6]|uniref:SRPBCC domain-containing protein n=1 Tax=Mesorhizobium sp. B2-4-6 TaxID=2589943 RepID=UPI001129CDA8|nr:SRPBCC domain-containing protein [Mesorhizobium sp. B2-4-6]TPL46449.1 hypothetical protein FJ957_17025 [Mesorhizobium sp. B2-4-6]